jgi:hypothetical protein
MIAMTYDLSDPQWLFATFAAVTFFVVVFRLSGRRGGSRDRDSYRNDRDRSWDARERRHARREENEP